MTRAKSFKRRTLPVLVSETVDCERLRCTLALALASCVAAGVLVLGLLAPEVLS